MKISLPRPLSPVAARLLLLFAAAACASCESLANAEEGISPQERREALQNRPLSDDEDSTLGRMTVRDDGVALRIAEF